MLRSALAFSALTISSVVHAVPNWVALTDSMADASFIDRAASTSQQRYVDVEVLRNFDQTVVLGNDPASGDALYPHQSVQLRYRVDCGASKLAMTGWKMFDRKFAEGNVIWAIRNQGEPAFLDAVDDESRAVLRTTCTTYTASR